MEMHSIDLQRRVEADKLHFQTALQLNATKSELKLRRTRSTLCQVRACSDKPMASPRASRIKFPPPQYWANPKQLVLTPRHEGVYTIDRSYMFLKYCDVGARCTVLVVPPLQQQHPSERSKLVLYSPVPIDSNLKSKLDELGDVSLIIAPNNEHVDFVADAANVYPTATILGPVGCRERWPSLPFDGDTFADGGVTPHPALAALRGAITPLFVPSAPFFNETVLVHRQSNTLVVCDLWWNWPDGREVVSKGIEVPLLTRAFALAMNSVFAPLYNRVLVRDRAQFAKFWQALLDTRFENLIPCHGYCVERVGRSVLDEFFPDFLKF